jgi:hypothetical protein
MWDPSSKAAIGPVLEKVVSARREIGSHEIRRCVDFSVDFCHYAEMRRRMHPKRAQRRTRRLLIAAALGTPAAHLSRILW